MTARTKPRARVGPALTAVAIAAAALGAIVAVQPRMASTFHTVKERDDVYILPPPRQLRAATLGYRSAVADMLWAKLLVEYGVHVVEKRPFPDLTKYMDAILALEPGYKPLFRYCDTLIVYHGGGAGTEEDARTARRYLERGIREQPYDHEIWLQYGQFVAFLGPSFFKNQADRDLWRKEGSEAILRAVELGADADRALSAASILSKAGETKALIAQLHRAYALTDDPATREEIAFKLERLQANAERESIEHDMKFVESVWRSDYSFLRRGEFMQIAPPVDPLRCAGPGASARKECRRGWDDRLPSRAP